MATKKTIQAHFHSIHIPVNAQGFSADEVRRLEEIRQARKARNWKLDPYRY